MMFQTIGKRLARSEAGTAVVEFAIIAPVLIFLLLGLIEVGRYSYYAIMAANSARAGVQYGARDITTANDVPGIKSAALADGQNLGNWVITARPLCDTGSGPTPTCTVPPSAGTVEYVEVVTTGTFSSLFNYPGLPSTLPVSGRAVMRVGNQ